MKHSIIWVSVFLLLLGGAVAYGDGVVSNLVPNPSFEVAGATGSQAESWCIPDLWYGYTRIPYSEYLGKMSGVGLTPASWDGSYLIKLVNMTGSTKLAAAYQSIRLNQSGTKPTPVQITARVSGLGIANVASDKWGACLYARIVLKSGKVVYSKNTTKTKRTGTFGWCWIGFNIGTFLNNDGSPEIDGPIDYIDLYCLLGSVNGTAYFDSVTVRQFPQVACGVVTFMFDDGEISTYTEGYPVLRSYGYVGTFAVVTNFIGQSGYMTLTQCHTLQDAGWEPAAHGTDHQDMSLMTKAQIDSQYYDTKQFFVQNGFRVSTFVLPYGGYNGDVIGVGQENYANYYTSIRGVERGPNPQGAFPYDVKIREVDSSTTLATLNGWIAEAKENHYWLVLLFHRIAPTSDDIYYTTPTFFRQAVAAVAQSGLKVRTYRDALKVFNDLDGTANFTAVKVWSYYY